MLAVYACYEQVRASDGQGEVSTIAVKLHDKTRVGEDYQVTPVAPAHINISPPNPILRRTCGFWLQKAYTTEAVIAFGLVNHR